MRGLVLSLKPKECGYEADRIVEEGKNRGWEVDHRFYENVCIDYHQSGLRFTDKGEEWNLTNYDWCYLRPTHYREYGGFSDLLTMVLMELHRRGTSIINGQSLLQWQHFPKTIQYYLLSQAKLPIIQSWHASTLELLETKLTYPVMVKKSLSSMGQGVNYIESPTELNRHVQTIKMGDVLYQQYLPIKEDYRVMIIDGKAVAGVTRDMVVGQKISNLSAGGTARQLKLDQSMIELATQAALTCRLDYCGVDLLRDELGNLFIIEINRLPQFQGLERVSGLNIAGMIIDSIDLHGKTKHD